MSVSVTTNDRVIASHKDGVIEFTVHRQHSREGIPVKIADAELVCLNPIHDEVRLCGYTIRSFAVLQPFTVKKVERAENLKSHGEGT